MTRSTNARIAGVTFLVYIAAGLTVMRLGSAGADGSAVKLAHVALELLCNMSALVLGVTLYAITREVDRDVAMLAMMCRVGEGVVGAVAGSMLVPASFFAVGSALFAYLFLRGRTIPVRLAWLGLAASVLVVAGIPMQQAGLLAGTATRLMWLPMLVFELVLGLWLIFKGVAARGDATGAAGSSAEAT
jgi:hypothetical protein